MRPTVPASDPRCEIDQGIGLGSWRPRPGTELRNSDPLIAALARYVDALHRRYPEGPEQMRRQSLDGRANITGMHPPKKDTAA